MIQFDKLEKEKEKFRNKFLLAKPFPHLIIDDFCDAGKLHQLVREMPDIHTKSRDYVLPLINSKNQNFPICLPYLTNFMMT
mgnify:CR=1 FL=1